MHNDKHTGATCKQNLGVAVLLSLEYIAEVNLGELRQDKKTTHGACKDDWNKQDKLKT